MLLTVIPKPHFTQAVIVPRFMGVLHKYVWSGGGGALKYECCTHAQAEKREKRVVF